MCPAAISPTMKLRVVIVNPPQGVAFAVQRGRNDLLLPTIESPAFIQFDLELRLGASLADSSPNYLGEFAQGTPADRFVYINSGTWAGQHASYWTRRAKLKLGSIPIEIAEAAIANSGQTVVARVTGTMADGSPICASVKPHAVIWELAKTAG
jgi:hypothetical protein